MAIANPDFFKSSADKQKKRAVSKAPSEGKKEKKEVALKINSDILDFMNKISEVFTNIGVSSCAKDMQSLIKRANKQRFTVAVVGEFSRGKSTFINNMFGKDFLPVANMPTTAMLTRIRYSAKESITVYDADKHSKKVLPLSEESWDNYIADDYGNDPNGVAFVGVDSPWLKNGIEIIDTPGAGDVEVKRAMLIDDALKGSDSAIITISAEAPMSMTEKLFVEQRLIAKKTPFLMLIITKLDRIDLRQRNSIVDFVKEKLKMWNMADIPVYIPSDIEMPDDKYSSVIGMDKVINQINSWIGSSERKRLTEQWLIIEMDSILKESVNILKEQKVLAEAENDEMRRQLFEEKADKISKAEIAWEDARLRMMERSNTCHEALCKKADEYKASIIERLQHDIGHVTNLKKWWDEDLPYRLKVEMSNMSVGIENTFTKQINQDCTWFNSLLEKSFKTSVIFKVEDIADKETYSTITLDNNVELQDLSKRKFIAKAGITTVSLAAALACLVVHVPTIVASSGIGTGGNMLMDTLFTKKVDEQRAILKEEISKNVPKVINKALEYTEGRIKILYKKILDDASEKEASWLEKQKDMIDLANSNAEFKDVSDIDADITKLENLRDEVIELITF